MFYSEMLDKNFFQFVSFLLNMLFTFERRLQASTSQLSLESLQIHFILKCYEADLFGGTNHV